jgi:uncharacterized membrane protein
MSAADFLGLWLHVLGLAVYGGASVAVVALLLPAARAVSDPAERRSVLARAFRVYDPLAVGALGVVVMTGAINLTSYKAALAGEFFQRLGGLLVWKLGTAFLVVMGGTYVAMGLGHRIVRAEALQIPVDGAQLDTMLRRVSHATWINLVILAITIWLGLALGHR